MKYLKTFEAAVNDREFISSMEDNIEAIFIDMIDDGFELDMTLTDYPGNCGHISIRKWKNNKKITEYLDIFHMFFDYITEKGYSINNINLGGWIKDENDKTISFSNKSWEFVEEHLIKATKDRNFKFDLEDAKIHGIKKLLLKNRSYMLP